jgi:hypothetical protein
MKHSWWILLFISQFTLAQYDKPEGPPDYSNAAGNPYLFKDWSDGIIRFTSGREMAQFKLKFDCVRNELLLQFNGSTFAAESKVKEFVIYTKSGKKKDSLLFRKGYPAIEKATDNTYYQVMFEGKIVLLRLFSRTIIQEKEIVSNGAAKQRLEETEYFYLLQDGDMTLLPQDKSDLLKLFPSKREQLAQFISENNLKMRSAEDFMQFARKYNEVL